MPVHRGLPWDSFPPNSSRGRMAGMGGGPKWTNGLEQTSTRKVVVRDGGVGVGVVAMVVAMGIWLWKGMDH